MMAFEIGHKKGILSDSAYKELVTELASIPGKIEKTLKVNDLALELARVFPEYTQCPLSWKRLSFSGSFGRCSQVKGDFLYPCRRLSGC